MTPATSARPDEPVTDDVKRQVVFVVGSGRSGTSTLSGTLQALGLGVPQPEVAADDTNPRGFGEPQWTVDLHDELLRRVNVQMSDGRPGAWLDASRPGTNERLRDRVYVWLEQQFAEQGPELVLKDPRLGWFIGLWRSAVLRCGGTPSYVTMLRPAPEVVGSKQRYYSQRFGEVSRTAGWVNVMLGTERATRGAPRAFVRYADLLRDWTIPVAALGERFDLQSVKRATPNDMRIVHNFIDPSLRRVQLTWDDIAVPARLRELAEETWRQLDALADPAHDTPRAHEALDELREAYGDFYADCEAVTESTAAAAGRDAVAGERARVAALEAPPPFRERVDKLAGRVPHGVRAAIPPSARRAFRQALGR